MEEFMDIHSKPVRIGLLFLGLIVLCGLALLYKGHDAVAMAKEKRDGIVTAEQVRVSFDSVNGRLLKENVKEGDHVQKGDILMVMDSTDTDLTIQRLESQIAQMDAEIASLSGTIDVAYQKADTDEVETHRQIDQQKAVIASSQASYENKLSDYNRMAQLMDAGAISKMEMDNVTAQLRVAEADVRSQKELLNKLLGGAQDSDSTEDIALPSISQERQSADNKANDLESLKQQKKQLEVQLAQQKVNRGRLVLRAPEGGKILKVIAKEGEMVSANTPVILLESDRYYYDIYINEQEKGNLKEGDRLTGHTVAGNIKVPGTVRLAARASGFADFKMSREKSSADLTAFQIRTYIDRVPGVIPGMTIEVDRHEFAGR